MTAKVTKFGPGTLTLGEVGSPIDVSCQVINAQIEWDKDKDDDQVVLCGETVAGATTYTASLTGEMFQDVADAAGILFYSWEHKGETVPFTFTPSTAAGTKADGELVLDPLTFGSDEPKANMTSDFTWDCVGEPVLTAGTPARMRRDWRRRRRRSGVTKAGFQVDGADTLAAYGRGRGEVASRSDVDEPRRRRRGSRVRVAAAPFRRPGVVAVVLELGDRSRSLVRPGVRRRDRIRLGATRDRSDVVPDVRATGRDPASIDLYERAVNDALAKVRGT